MFAKIKWFPIPAMLLAACSVANDSSNLASQRTVSSADLFSYLSDIAPSERVAATQQLGKMSIPAVYQALLASTDDAPLTIDGVTLAGAHQRLVQKASAFAAMAQLWPTMQDAWDELGTAPAAFSRTNFTAQLDQVLHLPNGLALAPTRASCDQGILQPGGTYMQVQPKTDAASNARHNLYKNNFGVDASDLAVAIQTAVRNDPVEATATIYGSKRLFQVANSNLYAYTDNDPANGNTGSIFLAVKRNGKYIDIGRSADYVFGCYVTQTITSPL